MNKTIRDIVEKACTAAMEKIYVQPMRPTDFLHGEDDDPNDPNDDLRYLAHTDEDQLRQDAINRHWNAFIRKEQACSLCKSPNDIMCEFIGYLEQFGYFCFNRGPEPVVGVDRSTVWGRRKESVALSESLALGIRARKAIGTINAVTVRDICECRPKDLLRILNVGNGTLGEIHHALAEHGLSLRDNSEGPSQFWLGVERAREKRGAPYNIAGPSWRTP